MKRLTRIGVLCAVMAMGWLLGACGLTRTAPTPAPPRATGSAVDRPQADLSATLEAPSSLPNGDTVRLKFILTNDSPEALYVLTWYTPLEGILGEIFRVKRDGQALPYEGPLVMRGNPLPEQYVFLEPGAAASAEVDLATVYDFSQAGEYTIQFLSPRISHVARTKADLAQTVDDLGPVEIPSNRVTITIGTP
jgi:peptidyl-Lys metalloendopeptidase